MLDGLLGRSGFSSKCKSLIKPTRTRIEVLRRRAEAKQRFLKEDLAKLLANGLDVNAYGRTEDFIAGLNLLSCYNFIDQSCEYILKQLSVMQKLGQCPEECRETVASLMFAAARFSDLPELRDLRDVFQERYGNGLECYVNQVFVEKLASKPPVVEKRIKLLQDIAAEFSIQWDSKGFKQRMDSPSTLAQDQVRNSVPLNGTDDKYKVPNENNVFRKNDHRSRERIEHIPQNDGSVNARRKEVSDIPALRTEEKHAQDQAMKLGPSTVTDDKYNIPNGNHVFHKNDHRSKERIEHAYEHNNGNANFRRKEVSNIPFVGREEKHAHKGPTLDLPFVGREEKRSHRYLSKTRPESDSENNGIGKNHIPSGSSPSHHDRRPEAFNHDKSERGREEKHDHRYLSKTRPEPDYENGIGKNQIPSSSSPSHHDRRPEAFNHHKSESKREEKRDHRYLSKTRPESDSENNGTGKNHIPSDSSPSHHDRRPEAFNHHKSERRREEKRDHRYLSNTRPESDFENNGIGKNHIPSGSSPSHHDRRPEDFNNDKAHRRRKERHTRMPKVNGEEEEEEFEKSTRKVEEEEPIRLLKPCYNNTLLPPPYTKPNLNIPPPYTKPNTHTHHEPPSSGDLPPENPSNSSRRNKEQQEHRHYPNDIPIPLPKPRSVRRKHSKSSSSHDDVGSSEDARIVKRISSSRRKERKGLQILFDDEHYHHKDEEEKVMDRLLLHYSKKPSNYDGKLRKKKSSKSPSVNDEVELETNVPPMRSISLPHESEQQPKKVYARANSFQPDNQAPHVHPKLPDYDDLAARFAALRGR